MGKLKRLVLVMCMMVVGGLLVGCGEEDNGLTLEDYMDMQEANEDDAEDADDSGDAEKYKDSAEKKVTYNEDSICYAYSLNAVTGKYVYEGRCAGFGVEYSNFRNEADVNKVFNKYGELKDTGYNSTEYAGDDEVGEVGDYTGGIWLMMINDVTNETSLVLSKSINTVSKVKKDIRLVEESSLVAGY